MPECIVRVELYGVTDYSSLNAVMLGSGFETIVKDTKGISYYLPTGTYCLPAGIEPSRRTAIERAKQTVSRALHLEPIEIRQLNEMPAILVVDSDNGVVWSGLASEL